MAFPYRGGPQSPRDAPPFSAYSSNPLSPPRNSNRLSGGFLGSSTTNTMNNTANEARAGLTRRFTTNALPTLSPIGQQRRMAAGDTMQVSCQLGYRLNAGSERHSTLRMIMRAGSMCIPYYVLLLSSLGKRTHSGGLEDIWMLALRQE